MGRLEQLANAERSVRNWVASRDAFRASKVPDFARAVAERYPDSPVIIDEDDSRRLPRVRIYEPLKPWEKGTFASNPILLSTSQRMVEISFNGRVVNMYAETMLLTSSGDGGDIMKRGAGEINYVSRSVKDPNTLFDFLKMIVRHNVLGPARKINEQELRELIVDLKHR